MARHGVSGEPGELRFYAPENPDHVSHSVKNLQRTTGITFIFVTHDQEEALTMSDRIAVMNRGRVEQIGSPIDIYDHPASTFVAGFIGSANLWPN